MHPRFGIKVEPQQVRVGEARPDSDPKLQFKEVLLKAIADQD